MQVYRDPPSYAAVPNRETKQVHPWEERENPQAYNILPIYGEHPNPTRNVLGLVGGNLAPYQGRADQVDTESDLRGTTRPLTFCPSREHAPLPPNPETITRKNVKENVTIKVAVTPLEQSQFWAYPAIHVPEPLVTDTCIRPETM